MKCRAKFVFLLIAVVLFMGTTSANSNLVEEIAENPVRGAIPSDIEFGYLYDGEYDMYSFIVWGGADEISLVLNGPSGADFDLFLSHNYQPSTSWYDYSSEGLTSYETITVNNPSTGTWYVMVYSYYGSGSYSLTLDVDYPTPTSSTPTPTPTPTPTTRTTRTTATPTPTPTSSPTSSTSSSSQSTSSINNGDSQPLLISNSTPLLLLGFVAAIIGVAWIAKGQLPKRYTPPNSTGTYQSSSTTSSSYNQRQTQSSPRPSPRAQELLTQGESHFDSGNYASAAAFMIKVLKIDPNNDRAREILFLSLQKLQ